MRRGRVGKIGGGGEAMTMVKEDTTSFLRKEIEMVEREINKRRKFSGRRKYGTTTEKKMNKI